VRALRATMRGALAEAAARRGALIAQMVVMGVNDVVWIAFWILFFRRAGTVRGWNGGSVLLLLAVLTTAGGIALGILANCRRIGVLALDGQLDAVLALPVAPLPYVLVRRVEPTNIADLVFGVCLFAATGHPTPLRTLVFVGAVLASATLLTSFLVLAGSLAFFGGRSEGGELGFHAMLLLSAYPVDIFAGATKVLLYTVVPAAFVSSVPARLIGSFDAGRAAALLGVAALFATAAWATFTLGLRRYTSGALWTRA
jgi:ABC-2 type transport system permease protein